MSETVAVFLVALALFVADVLPKEPAGFNGRRVNLGFYGNTPYATRSAPRGFAVIGR